MTGLPCQSIQLRFPSSACRTLPRICTSSGRFLSLQHRGNYQKAILPCNRDPWILIRWARTSALPVTLRLVSAFARQLIRAPVTPPHAQEASFARITSNVAGLRTDEDYDAFLAHSRSKLVGGQSLDHAGGYPCIYPQVRGSNTCMRRSRRATMCRPLSTLGRRGARTASPFFRTF